MKRVQFLEAASKLIAANSDNPVYKCVGLSGQTHNLAKKIQTMAYCDQDELRHQALMELTRVRRECNARSPCYDINRHIQLFLLHKALNTFFKANGPVRGQR